MWLIYLVIISPKREIPKREIVKRSFFGGFQLPEMRERKKIR
jgi:hypothetical protein